MDFIEIYSKQSIIARTKKRHGETKLGEMVVTIQDPDNWQDELKLLPQKFVIFGIPEDIGVRANYGRGGTHTAWKPSLDFLINMQSNQFLIGNEMLVLGHINCDDLMEQANLLNFKSDLDIKKARLLVEAVDERVIIIVKSIVQSGKIPIVIGGGHNNAYPLIAACAQVNGLPINVINCDPHSDLRPMQGRHSGNGFHYALHQQYLNKYAIFGMHESYNIYSAMQLIDSYPDRLMFVSYDDIFVRDYIQYFDGLKQCLDFVENESCGIEVDLDSIQNIPVSARTPSGMLPIDVRKFVWHSAANLKVAYFHIAEGAPVLAHKQVDNKTGKLVAYLITDFIKSVLNKN